MIKVETVQTEYTQIRSENNFVVLNLFRQVAHPKDFSWPYQSSLDLEVIYKLVEAFWLWVQPIQWLIQQLKLCNHIFCSFLDKVCFSWPKGCVLYTVPRLAELTYKEVLWVTFLCGWHIPLGLDLAPLFGARLDTELCHLS